MSKSSYLGISIASDIGANVEGMQPVMRDYCKNP